MFLNMSYSAKSCSHYAVSNAITKVTKKSKPTNNYQNLVFLILCLEVISIMCVGNSKLGE